MRTTIFLALLILALAVVTTACGGADVGDAELQGGTDTGSSNDPPRGPSAAIPSTGGRPAVSAYNPPLTILCGIAGGCFDFGFARCVFGTPQEGEPIDDFGETTTDIASADALAEVVEGPTAEENACTDHLYRLNCDEIYSLLTSSDPICAMS